MQKSYAVHYKKKKNEDLKVNKIYKKMVIYLNKIYKK